MRKKYSKRIKLTGHITDRNLSALGSSLDRLSLFAPSRGAHLLDCPFLIYLFMNTLKAIQRKLFSITFLSPPFSGVLF